MKYRVLAAIAAGLAGVALTPAAVAQTQTECVTQQGELQNIEVCPSQTGSSTGTQFFNFVSDLGTRISQQRQVVRDTEEESEEEEGQTDTTAFGPALGGAASADDRETGITAYGRLSSFGIADYTDADREATSSGQSYDQETEAAILGFDYRLSNTLFAGATFNYLSGDTDLGDDRGSTDVDSYVLGAHGSKYWGDVYLEALVTYGRFDLDIERVDAFDSRFGASPDGKLHSADVALGYVHSRNRWRITPVAKLLYLDGSIDGYREDVRSGFGSPETVEKQDFGALNLELSLQTDYVILRNWGVLIPSLKVAYHHEFDDRHTVRGVRSGTSFAEKPDEPDRNTVVVRAGVSAQFQRGWSAFASFERLFEHSYLDRDDFVVGVRYEFF